jgi:4-aminobutyrate aminotransferase-like enzyme
MVGVILANDNAHKVTADALKKGVIVNAVRPNIIRITPPLNIPDNLLIEGILILKELIELE